MKANIGTQNLTPSRIIADAHPPIIVSASVLEDNGVLADGQIVAKDADGEVIPHELIEDVAMTGDIDGANKDYTTTLDPAPVLPGSVVIANNNAVAQEVTDDGEGNLIGDGSGTINYKTGEVSVSLTTAPAAGKTVLISHKTRPIGVNVQECDTEEDDTALVVKHGSVNKDLLLRGEVAADAEDIAALESIGIFTV